MKHPYAGTDPRIHETAFVAGNATVIGDVAIDEHASVWFGAVLRGDIGPIHIGKNSNVQDGCVLHNPWEGELAIGNDVTVGHRAIVHGCRIGDRVLIGMGAVIMDYAEIGDDSIIGAGAIVTERTVIPPRSLVMGIPGTVKRMLTDDEVKELEAHARQYAELAKRYRTTSPPYKGGELNYEA